MIIEMRTYKTKPGRRADFLEVFRSKSIPAHAEIGMKILGPFFSVDDPNTFFFMRGFPDFASHEPLKARFLRRGTLEVRTGEYPDADAGEVRSGRGGRLRRPDSLVA
jgi:hypothetical protein